MIMKAITLRLIINLQINNQTRVEEMTAFDFESLDKTCFKEELQFDYMEKVYNFVKSNPNFCF